MDENPDSQERKTTTAYQPRTDLGKRLWEIRQRIVASGVPLLGWDEIERELAERRGDRGDDRQ